MYPANGSGLFQVCDQFFASMKKGYTVRKAEKKKEWKKASQSTTITTAKSLGIFIDIWYDWITSEQIINCWKRVGFTTAGFDSSLMDQDQFKLAASYRADINTIEILADQLPKGGCGQSWCTACVKGAQSVSTQHVASPSPSSHASGVSSPVCSAASSSSASWQDSDGVMPQRGDFTSHPRYYAELEARLEKALLHIKALSTTPVNILDLIPNVAIKTAQEKNLAQEEEKKTTAYHLDKKLQDDNDKAVNGNGDPVGPVNAAKMGQLAAAALALEAVKSAAEAVVLAKKRKADRGHRQSWCCGFCDY